ncbi:L-Ala-D/L-Glu epimerase [Athalassotoga saccharophila]|uniref:L-Ala-D/L-Glu epimerase n=1 Tax=Athalassotoga saccharophila TaxID=1441386 RepID=UPI0018D6B64E|nr:L-Ala-D/L-Glu epimerase [Athalassotoga saccharophila]BBJ28939.1 L-Ala-D/L-Glu epimerase [Athalassotoga saccharophila]
MKISDVKFELKRYEYHETFHITGSSRSTAKNIEVKLLIDDGTIGMGEASPSYRVNGEVAPSLLSIESNVREMIKGIDVREYAKVFRVMDGLSKSAPSIKAAIQYATLDALSIEIGLPVYKILGGSKDTIETDKTISIDTLERMVQKSVETFSQGFHALKIKVGENLKEDMEKILAISEATKGAEYVIDANQGYSPKEALQFAKFLYENRINVKIFEQPVIWNDFEGLKLVRHESPVPIAADESVRTKYDAYRLIKDDCVDFINIKLMKSGISDALAIIEMAKTTNIGLMIGCMSESSLGINQSVHIAAGTGAFAHCDLDSHMLIKEDKFRGKFVQNGSKMNLTSF